MASLSRWLRRRRIRSTKTPKTKDHRRKLWLETLEDRVTPDASYIFSPQFFGGGGSAVFSGNLQVNGNTVSSTSPVTLGLQSGSSVISPFLSFPGGMTLTVQRDSNSFITDGTITTPGMGVIFSSGTQPLVSVPDGSSSFSLQMSQVMA